MTITALPPPPPRGDPGFSEKADALWSALPLFVAELNAIAAAMSLNSTNSVSSTSMLIEVAEKIFTVEASKSYVLGQTVKIASTASPTNWMLGDVSDYNPLTGLIKVQVSFKQGSGTFAAWTVSQSAPVPVTIPSTSKTIWFQAAAPVGWTQITTHNDKALRVVSGAGGGTGGSVAFTTAFASQAVTGSNSATTLTKGQIPQHVHTYERTVTGSGNGLGGSAPYITTGNVVNTGNGSADGVGGGSHTHPFTGNPINLAVHYLDMILASKD